MAKQRKPRNGRYDVTGNIEAEYVDEAQSVLRNKLGMSDLSSLFAAEESALFRAYETLANVVTVDTPITCALIQRVHSEVFGGIYDWAGRWRTVWISKPGTTWPPPDYLESSMAAYEREILTKYPAAALADDLAFAEALGEIQGEFLVIHPFREGNARTIKLVTDLLALQTGRPPLKYDHSSDQAVQAYIAAAKAAFRRDYKPLTVIIRAALARAMQSS
jgi:cell filamentation protein